MIHLPEPPQQSWVIGFWAALLGLGAVPLAGLFFLLFGVGGVAVAVLLIFGLAAAGRVRDWRVARLVYQLWNRLAAAYAAAAGCFIVRVCYYLIVMPVGKCGSTLQLSRQASVWTPRPREVAKLAAAASGQDLRDGWLRNYLRWAGGSAKTWTLALVPFIAFLNAVGREEPDPDVPTNIYTLY